MNLSVEMAGSKDVNNFRDLKIRGREARTGTGLEE